LAGRVPSGESPLASACFRACRRRWGGSSASDWGVCDMDAEDGAVEVVRGRWFATRESRQAERSKTRFDRKKPALADGANAAPRGAFRAAVEESHRGEESLGGARVEEQQKERNSARATTRSGGDGRIIAGWAQAWRRGTRAHAASGVISKGRVRVRLRGDDGRWLSRVVTHGSFGCVGKSGLHVGRHVTAAYPAPVFPPSGQHEMSSWDCPFMIMCSAQKLSPHGILWP